MHVPPISLLPPLLLLVVPVFSFERDAQHALQLQDSDGAGTGTAVLRHYEVHSAREAEDVMALAEDNGWDVWHASPTGVDVFFPASASAPPSSPHANISQNANQNENAVSQYTFRDTPYPHSLLHPHSSLEPGTAERPTAAPEEPPWNLTSLANTTFHAAYHTLGGIHAFVRALAAAYPAQVRIVRLGHSGEGREMYAVEITGAGEQGEGREGGEEGGGGGDGGEGKKEMGFVVTGAQHAREWVATAASLYLTHALVANASEPGSLAYLLKDYKFYIVPVPNPDGYLYTWEHDRFWYKNRLDLGPQAKCTGVDMNRNWGYKWKRDAADSANVDADADDDDDLHDQKGNGEVENGSGEVENGNGEVQNTNTNGKVQKGKGKKGKKGKKDRKQKEDTCSHWYPGRRAFQAPEVNNMANYFDRLRAVDVFVDLRAYGQMLSTPYSYSCKRSPKDAEDQLEAAQGASHAAKKVHGAAFTTGTLCSTLYRAPGNIVDWMYERRGVKYSFAAHLRDTGTYGFALPEKWIRPVGEETAKMVAYLAEFVAKQAGGKK
ncbi:hypothetical protein DENSPDRAFT_838908 [Dentipellis sp. KUC8613]|nr:hypothetical protein DENSPDRAFT_838908 [Dentipellis sp. KUC8613]